MFLWMQMEDTPSLTAGRLPPEGSQMVALSEQWDGARGVLGEGGCPLQ